MVCINEQYIHIVRKVVEYYINNNSPVNLCCHDISEEFDKLNHLNVIFKANEKRCAIDTN